MMKRIKLSVCCILTLALLFTFTCGSAFALDTKTVTVTTTKTFTCSGPEISGNIQSIQSSTYNYDDGTYKGTLNNTQINSVNVVPISTYYYGVYQVTVNVTYSGTVTRYDPPTTKSVYVTVDRTFTCVGPQVNNNMLAIQNSTYYYDDGVFRGTLNYSKISDVKVTVVGNSPSGDVLQFNVKVDYSGTVTSYN